jgi:riboflavin synthase
MFTGIVQAIGQVTSVENVGEDRRLHIGAGALDMSDVAIGESICVSGVCLTVVAFDKEEFSVDVSAETLARTTLGDLQVSDRVNLERALTPSTRLGGHLVSGHVDGVGHVLARRPAGRSLGLRIGAPASLAKYIAEKGSICVDGVSLTVNGVNGAEFEVNIVPHTLRETTFGSLVTEQRVNLEVDMIARYLERLLLGEAPQPTANITPAFLAKHGFTRGS